MEVPDKDDSRPLLGPGFHEIPEDVWGLCFVAGFPESATRDHLLRKLQSLIDLLRQLGLTGEAWLDGSFLTDKTNPKDTDLVIFVDPLLVLPDHAWAHIDALFSSREAYARYDCDAYLVNINDFHKRAYWRGLFTFMRDEVTPKGIVKFRL